MLLDIQPMEILVTQVRAQVILVQVRELNVTEPVNLYLPLPEGLTRMGETMTVKQTNRKGETFLHDQEIKQDDSGLYLGFENENGFPTFELKVSKCSISKTNMRFGSDLSLLFAVEQDKVDGNGCYAKVTHNGKTVTISQKDWTQTVINETPYYTVEYSGIAGKQMSDPITVQIFRQDGTKLTNLFETSVRQYAMSRLEKSTDDSFKTLIVDMLNYGASAQQKFSYNTENPANALLSEAQKALGTKTMKPCQNELKSDGTYYHATNVRYDNSISMLFWMKNMTNDMSVKFSFVPFNSISGQRKEVIINGEDFTMVNSTDFAVELKDLKVTDARQTITCEIYEHKNAEGHLLGTIQDSISSYVARKDAGERSQTLNDFMKFADSAMDYVTNH